MGSRQPFGLPTFFHGRTSPTGQTNPVRLCGSQRVTSVVRTSHSVNESWLDRWKVLTIAFRSTSAAMETKFLSKPTIGGLGTACTEAYLVAGHFDTERKPRTAPGTSALGLSAFSLRSEKRLSTPLGTSTASCWTCQPQKFERMP